MIKVPPFQQYIEEIKIQDTLGNNEIFVPSEEATAGVDKFTIKCTALSMKNVIPIVFILDTL